MIQVMNTANVRRPTVHGSASLSLLLPPGNYPFQYSYADFLDRPYSASGTIKVLAAGDYDRLIAATRAAQLPLY